MYTNMWCKEASEGGATRCFLRVQLSRSCKPLYFEACRANNINTCCFVFHTPFFTSLTRILTRRNARLFQGFLHVAPTISPRPTTSSSTFPSTFSRYKKSYDTHVAKNDNKIHAQTHKCVFSLEILVRTASGENIHRGDLFPPRSPRRSRLRRV